MAGVLVAPGLLEPSECEALVERSEALGFEFASVQTRSGQRSMPDIRNNSRAMFDDPALAKRLWPRIEPIVPKIPQPTAPWGLSPRFRIYRYGQDQRFKPHRDGVEHFEGRRSRLTVLVYLNDDFLGGETTFFETVRADGTKHTVEHPVFPAQGMAVLFEHRRLHEGSEVIAGTKYVLRTDVLFSS